MDQIELNNPDDINQATIILLQSLTPSNRRLVFNLVKALAEIKRIRPRKVTAITEERLLEIIHLLNSQGEQATLRNFRRYMSNFDKAKVDEVVAQAIEHGRLVQKKSRSGRTLVYSVVN